MANPTQTAKLAASEDKKQTGPAGLPNTKPVGIKPRLSDEERQKRKAQTLADHERLLEVRTQQVCHFLKDMGIASLAGRIGEYSDVSADYIEASLTLVEQRVADCRAALKARGATSPAVAKVNLRELAAKLAAQRNGTPAAGQ